MSAVAEFPGLHQAHVRKPTWLFSTDFHMTFHSTLSNQRLRATRVLNCTTWEVRFQELLRPFVPTRCVSIVLLSQLAPNVTRESRGHGSRLRLQIAGNNSYASVSPRRLGMLLWAISAEMDNIQTV